MEPMMKQKRPGSVFIPYRSTSGVMEFYLQKRDMNAPVHKGIFSMFGGAIEGGETPEEGCLREAVRSLKN